MANALFRKSALDRIASPEQLDVLLRVTSPRAWVGLATAGFLIVLTLIWGFAGSIPTRVSSNGILITSGGVLQVSASGSGRVAEILVSEGQSVVTGQVVARIAQPELAMQIENARAELKEEQELRQLTGKELSLRTAREQGQLEGVMKINATARRISLLQAQLDEAARVVSPRDGKVLELKTAPGDLVNPGSSIFSLQVSGKRAQDLQAILFFPSTEGKKIARGMEMQLSPATAKREEFGFLYGIVTYVSDFPSTRQGMMAMLSNDDLVRTFSGSGAPFAVYVRLVPDPRAAGGYKWSSSRGSEIVLQSGTLCSGNVVVRRQRPITLVLPFLRQLLGL